MRQAVWIVFILVWCAALSGVAATAAVYEGEPWPALLPAGCAVFLIFFLVAFVRSELRLQRMRGAAEAKEKQLSRERRELPPTLAAISDAARRAGYAGEAVAAHELIVRWRHAHERLDMEVLMEMERLTREVAQA